MADAEKGKTREEEEYVPADYVAPAEADEQVKGGRWSQVCDWPLAFRTVSYTHLTLPTKA